MGVSEGAPKLLKEAERKAERAADFNLHHDSLVPIIERLVTMAMDNDRRRLDAVYILDYLARFVQESDLRDALKCLESTIWYVHFSEKSERWNKPIPEPVIESLRCLEEEKNERGRPRLH